MTVARPQRLGRTARFVMTIGNADPWYGYQDAGALGSTATPKGQITIAGQTHQVYQFIASRDGTMLLRLVGDVAFQGFTPITVQWPGIGIVPLGWSGSNYQGQMTTPQRNQVVGLDGKTVGITLTAAAP